MNIRKSLTAFDDWDNYELAYVETPKASTQFWMNSVGITCLDNAGKRGKSCVHWSIATLRHDGHASLFSFISDVSDWDLVRLLGVLDSLGMVTNERGHARINELPKYLDISIERTELDGNRVWSPFMSVNPLTAIPRKLTIPHVTRALLAGQCRDVRCTGHYTDDYAFDAADNFGKGSASPVGLAKSIMERPSGWWCSLGDNNLVTVCCHHFDNYKFTLDLNATN